MIRLFGAKEYVIIKKYISNEQFTNRKIYCNSGEDNPLSLTFLSKQTKLI